DGDIPPLDLNDLTDVDIDSPSNGEALIYNSGVWENTALGGSGTVTSVSVSGSDGIEVDSGSPITTSGTIALGVNASTLRSHINVEDGAEVNTVDSVNGQTGVVVLSEEDIIGTADEDTITGAVNVSLTAASFYFLQLTGNTTITF